MSKETSKRAATKASGTLRSDDTSSKSKTAAASALSQRKAPARKTTPAAAKKASATLRDGRSAAASKSAAGSALSQTARKRKS